MDNRQLTMKEYTQVDQMSWDELMVALKRRAARKEREVVSEEEEEEEEKAREADPTNNRRNLDGSVPQSRFSCVYGTRSGRPWKVEVSAENIRCYMRAFESEEEAARLADRALFYLTGSKARLNFPDETPGPLEPEMAAKIDARRQAVEAKQDQPDAAAGPSNKSMDLSGQKRKERSEDSEHAEEAMEEAGEISRDRKRYIGTSGLVWSGLVWSGQKRKARSEDSGHSEEEEDGEEEKEMEVEEEDRLRTLTPIKQEAVYKGVSTQGKGWCCQLYLNSKCVLYLNAFGSTEEAARLYDRASFYVFGDKAKLNFPDQDPGELEADMAAKIDKMLKSGGKDRKILEREAEDLSAGQDGGEKATTAGDDKEEEKGGVPHRSSNETASVTADPIAAEVRLKKKARVEVMVEEEAVAGGSHEASDPVAGGSHEASDPVAPSFASVDLIVRDHQSGNDFSFRIKGNKRFKKILSAYCNMTGLDRRFLRLLYNGRQIMTHSTPQELGMKDGSLIIAFNSKKERKGKREREKGLRQPVDRR